MTFMNADEILEAKDKFHAHPILGPATRFLDDFRQMVDAHSDGWCYWPRACQSAQKLIQLIQAGPDSATEAGFKRALTPIKSLCTRRKLPCPQVVRQPRSRLLLGLVGCPHCHTEDMTITGQVTVYDEQRAVPYVIYQKYRCCRCNKTWAVECHPGRPLRYLPEVPVPPVQ